MGGKFRDPTLLIQFLASILGVVVALNVGLSDEQAALWLAGINALFGAINAVFVRPIAPAMFTGLVSAAAAIVAAYGFEIRPELLAAINFAVVNGIALFFTRPNVTPVSDPQAGQGVPEKVATQIRSGTSVV
jgi:hypothetical protein